MKNLKNIAVGSALLFSTLAKAQEYNKIKERTKQVLDSTYNALIKKYKVVGMSIAIVDNGEIVYSAGYGFADRENKIAANGKTIYRIGSCTKSFTSLSLLQLQEKRQLNVNNSVREYLPGFRIDNRYGDNNQFTISDMMCHLAGLPCDIGNGFFCDAPPGQDWVVNELNKQTTISPRQYKFAYSNIAYGLLGEVVAARGNVSYENYLKQNVFTPLDMNSTFISPNEKSSKDLSKGYFNDKELKEPLIRDVAAGLIHSNVLDMANYIKMYLNKGSYNGKQVLSPESLSEMEKNRMNDALLSSTENYGYGIMTKKAWVKTGKDSAVATIIGHGGDTYVFHSDFAYMPGQGVGAVILTNSDNGVKLRSVNKLLKIYLKEEKGTTLNMNYRNPADSALIAGRETACTAADAMGVYNFGEFTLRVKNTRKVKFKQGPATIVMKEKSPGSLNYKMKARIFGIIPVKIRDQAMTFVKVHGDVYVKAINTKSKAIEYIAVKAKPQQLSQSWKEKFGSYTVVNASYKCTGCPYGVNDGMRLVLAESKGFMFIKTKGKTPDLNNTAYLDLLSDKMAVTGGIGRGTGETVRILDNGNIYYSGFEFAKAK